MDQEDLKIRIMRRVYLASVLRQIFSPFMLRIYIGIVVVWQIILSVSISNVYKNLPSISNPSRLYSFISTAFMNTDTWVKILSICLLAILLWISKDFIANAKGIFSREHALGAKN